MPGCQDAEVRRREACRLTQGEEEDEGDDDDDDDDHEGKKSGEPWRRPSPLALTSQAFAPLGLPSGPPLSATSSVPPPSQRRPS